MLEERRKRVLRRMRVLLLASETSVHNQDILRMLQESGVDAKILSFAVPNGSCARTLGATSLSNAFPGMILPNVLPSYAMLRREIRRWKPTILHAVFLTTYGLLGAISAFHPFVAMPMASDVLLEPKRSPLAKFSVLVVATQADLILCDSAIVRDEFLRLAPRSEPKVRSFSRGVDTSLYVPGPKPRELEERWQTKGRTVILSNRWLHPDYSVHKLVEAVDLLGTARTDLSILIVGSGPAAKTLKELVSSRGLQGLFRFVGRIDPSAIPAVYRLADIYVSTSPSDGTSISLLEAMSCGLPVVVTRIPGNMAWVRDGTTGYLFDPADSRDLSDKLRILLGDPKARFAMGQAGRELVATIADRSSAKNKLVGLYEDLIDRSRRREPSGDAQ